MTEPGFRNQRARDKREMAAIAHARQVTIKAMLLTLIIVVAPFLALLHSLDLALGVLALVLTLSALLTLYVANMSGPAYRSRLRTIAALNGVLMLVTVGILALRLTS